MKVFLYAGQGSQKNGMGKDIYEACKEYRDVFDSFPNSENLRYIMEEAPIEELTKTENTQPCMAAFAAGVTNVLNKKGIYPDAACGLSLGEYGALYAAGVFDADTYLDVVSYRGKVMGEAALIHTCHMSAVLGIEAEYVEKACELSKDKGFITVANYNCPLQYVICGDEEAVIEAEKKALELGAKRCIRLNTGGPFHTPYMENAAHKLKEKLDEIEIKKAKIPVVLNVNGSYLKEDDNLREILEMQMKSSVRFEKSLELLLKDGADTFIEIGPGNALSGFVKKTAKKMNKKVNVYSISDIDSLNKCICM